MLQPGDRVDVVLDVFPNAEFTSFRVVLVGVFEPTEATPPAAEGAFRNRVQTWLGTPHNLSVFRMPIEDAKTGG